MKLNSTISREDDVINAPALKATVDLLTAASNTGSGA